MRPKNHEPNKNRSLPFFYIRCRMNKPDEPSKTVTTHGETDAPWISNHDHNNPVPTVNKRSICLRAGSGAEPAKTVVGEGPAAELIPRSITASSPYAELLSRELPKEAPPANGLKEASFFCGCGGIDLGLRSAGFELAYANDLFKDACSTFEHNLGHAPVCADIREVCGSTVPDVDLLTGGFPCVTFSMAGKRMGVVDDLNGKLYLELCRLIGEVGPRYFVAENVKGMVSANKGKAIKLVLASFLKLGYRTTYTVVNMAEHGVPQLRWRVIFVGVRLDQWRGSFIYPKKTHRAPRDKKAPRWLPKAVSLRTAIAGLGPPNEEVMAATYPGAASTIVDGRSTSYEPGKPRDADGPAPAQMASNAGSIVLKSKKRGSFGDLRRMTVRESARVQTFPDWFELKGSQSACFKQVGNAVPPLYAKRLGEALLEYDKRRKV